LDTFFDDFSDKGEGLWLDGCVAMALQRQQDGLLQKRRNEFVGENVSVRHGSLVHDGGVRDRNSEIRTGHLLRSSVLTAAAFFQFIWSVEQPIRQTAGSVSVNG